LPNPVPVVSQTRTYWPLEKDMPVSPAVIPTGQFSAHLVLFLALVNLEVIQKVSKIVGIFDGNAHLRHAIDQGGRPREVSQTVQLSSSPPLHDDSPGVPSWPAAVPGAKCTER
jgi:hypothetical protein